MGMITVKGRGGVVLSLAKQEYRPINGLMTIPAELEGLAKAHGFVKISAAEASAAKLALDEVATLEAGLPAGHPQAIEMAEQTTENVAAARETNGLEPEVEQTPGNAA
jgi:hypothetical protein